MTTTPIFDCWDNDYTYFVRDGKVILGTYSDQNPALAAEAFRAAGLTVVEGGEVSDAIKRAYVDDHPMDPEAEGLDNDSFWLERALERGYVTFTVEEATLHGAP